MYIIRLVDYVAIVVIMVFCGEGSRRMCLIQFIYKTQKKTKKQGEYDSTVQKLIRGCEGG